MRNLICLLLLVFPFLLIGQEEDWRDLSDAENLLQYWLEAQLDYYDIPVN